MNMHHLSLLVLVIFALFGFQGCQTLDKAGQVLAKNMKDCLRDGGEYTIEKGCVMPDASDDQKPPPDPIKQALEACAQFGHTTPALFRKSHNIPAKQFRVELNELGDTQLHKGRLTALVSGFGDLERPDTDSIFLLIETRRPASAYRVVFYGDTWITGARMITRFTAQHFVDGTRKSNIEKMEELEHTFEPSMKYLFDCQWDSLLATCRVFEHEGEQFAITNTSFLAPLGKLIKPLAFGDKVVQAYQGMGPEAMVERACLSVYPDEPR